MSVFGSILSKIFGHANAAPSEAATPSTAGAPPSGTAGTPATGGAPATPGGAGAPQVDVEAVLSDLAAKSGRPSNWRTSIVDLMTLLGLDSSLKNRQELAKELGYTGDPNDTAPMNIWLHKQVMTKLAANGGKVPDDLKD
ncbi:DUF3597 domain-containing protein [Roseomonas sp. NAR14]|uniref:DUF3597 domain-containing protein n=1 Tax=Roseomonas acroporae TaxID=2937791 RepID=A0A9X1Y9S9_9PROT|nr:DUF3597 domain-containing protein [Roseomonas acroporae]MCK8786156.1 DUF3597 domain-containing protein [Roseomonas acroporae]